MIEPLFTGILASLGVSIGTLLWCYLSISKRDSDEAWLIFRKALQVLPIAGLIVSLGLRNILSYLAVKLVVVVLCSGVDSIENFASGGIKDLLLGFCCCYIVGFRRDSTGGDFEDSGGNLSLGGEVAAIGRRIVGKESNWWSSHTRFCELIDTVADGLKNHRRKEMKSLWDANPEGRESLIVEIREGGWRNVHDKVRRKIEEYDNMRFSGAQQNTSIIYDNLFILLWNHNLRELQTAMKDWPSPPSKV